LSNEGLRPGFQQLHYREKTISDEAIRARSELEQYRGMKRTIENMKDRIEQLTVRINAAGRQPKDVDIQYMPDPKAVEALLTALTDLRSLYGQTQIKAERLCFDLERRIGFVSGIPGLILEWRYIQGFSFEKIAVKLDYSYRQIRRLHVRALEEYAERWPPMSH